MQIPYFDLKAQCAELHDDIRAAFERVCRNAEFILGEEVARFESEFAAYCEARHCVALNSGTSALHLALLAVGVRAGHQVITTPNTFVATVEAIVYAGAEPVFVDIDPATGNIDPSRIENALTPRTKAIVPVHLYGRPAHLDPILRVAREHNLMVIEDACQAHGARYRGKRVGSLGHGAAFSFYPTKNLGAYGEAGALVTNDDDIARFARAMRDHGQTSRYLYDYVGYNYRMEGMQGAVLRVKLNRLEELNRRRQLLAGRYRALLADARVNLPQDDPRDECVYHLFVVYADDRDGIRAALEARGVQTAIHYPRPLHLQRAYAALGCGAGSFPHAEHACQHVLSMPFFPELTGEQVEEAAGALSQLVGSKRTRPILRTET
jgi:dTDP-4-amino-4,6-dideoxygalactose transaminase